MISSFVNPVVNLNAKLSVSFFDNITPLRLWQNHSQVEVDMVIRAVYRQVLGNAYVMESERLTVPESQLRQGEISVREFVRQLALSNLYRSQFFEACSRMRSIELNFKHLLGRAPESHAEIVEHSHWLDQGGVEAEIDSYLDSDEYLSTFGEDIVPYYRGHKTQTGRNTVGFTHLLALARGVASSDKDPTSQNRSRLSVSLMTNRPSSIAPVVDLPSSWQPPTIVSPQFPAPAPAQGGSATRSPAATEVALQQKIQEHARAIATLQQQLIDLRPFAAIGITQFKRDWQSPSGSVVQVESASLQQQMDAQVAQIAVLQEQIADARRDAAIGESRLNKWRSRTFNG